jgi:Transcriptional regulator PadR-like family
MSNITVDLSIVAREPRQPYLLNALKFFYTPPLSRPLREEECVAYVLGFLLEGDSYATEMVNRLTTDTNFSVSESVLTHVLNHLKDEGIVTQYKGQSTGRGRSPIMFALNAQFKGYGELFGLTWSNFKSQNKQFAFSSADDWFAAISALDRLSILA